MAVHLEMTFGAIISVRNWDNISRVRWVKYDSTAKVSSLKNIDHDIWSSNDVRLFRSLLANVWLCIPRMELGRLYDDK